MSVLLAILIYACGLQQVSADESNRTSEPVRIVLAGDSTVTDDAGWGRGFSELLTGNAECINLAKGGRSSRSYRTEGWWQQCLDAEPDYLLIQFGHNDQPGKGPERESAAGRSNCHRCLSVRSCSSVGHLHGLGSHEVE